MESLQDIATSVFAIELQPVVKPRIKRKTAIVQPAQPIVTVLGAVPRGEPQDTTVFRHLHTLPPTTAASHRMFASIAAVTPQS